MRKVMKIKILIAVELPEQWFEKAVGRYAKWSLPDTGCSGYDPSYLNNEVEDPGKLVMEMASRAKEEGADGCIIDCFGDPGLEKSRNKVDIPVVGVGEQGMFFARTLGSEFGMITSDDSALEDIKKNANFYGLGENMKRASSISVPAEEVPNKLKKVKGLLLDEALKFPRDISTIVLGCTELAELAPGLTRSLRKEGRNVLVINPIMITVRQLETRLLQEKGAGKGF